MMGTFNVGSTLGSHLIAEIVDVCCLTISSL